jgi:hypothetical protein
MRKWTNFCENFAKILLEFSKNQKISRNMCEQMCSNVSIQLSLGLNFRFLVFAKVFVFSQKIAKNFATIFKKIYVQKLPKIAETLMM